MVAAKGPSLRKKRKPERARALELLKRVKPPANIVAHNKAVARFSYALARALQKAGAGVNPVEVESAALLHDALKVYLKPYQKSRTVVISGREITVPGGQYRDERITRAWLERRGVPDSGLFISSTNAFRVLLNPQARKHLSLGQKVLILADNHAQENRIVSLADRKAYHLEKYKSVKGRTRRHVERMFAQLERIEEEFRRVYGVDVSAIVEKLSK